MNTDSQADGQPHALSAAPPNHQDIGSMKLGLTSWDDESLSVYVMKALLVFPPMFVIFMSV